MAQQCETDRAGRVRMPDERDFYAVGTLQPFLTRHRDNRRCGKIAAGKLKEGVVFGQCVFRHGGYGRSFSKRAGRDFTMSMYETYTANSTKNTKPTVMIFSFTAKLKSRRSAPSISNSKICPPSRIGIGKRLKIPRLMLMNAIKVMKSYGPCRAASPACWLMPIGPAMERGDIRRSSSFPAKSKIIMANVRLRDRFLKGLRQRKGFGNHQVLKRHADSPHRSHARRVAAACRDRGIEPLAGAFDHQMQRRALALLHNVDHLGTIQDDLAVHRIDPIARLNAGVGSGFSRIDRADHRGQQRAPSSYADALTSLDVGRDGSGVLLTVAHKCRVDGMRGIRENMKFQDFPIGIGDAVEFRDAVAGLNAGLGGRRVLRDVSDF